MKKVFFLFVALLSITSCGEDWRFEKRKDEYLNSSNRKYKSERQYMDSDPVNRYIIYKEGRCLYFDNLKQTGRLADLSVPVTVVDYQISTQGKLLGQESNRQICADGTDVSVNAIGDWGFIITALDTYESFLCLYSTKKYYRLDKGVSVAIDLFSGDGSAPYEINPNNDLLTICCPVKYDYSQLEDYLNMDEYYYGLDKFGSSLEANVPIKFDKKGQVLIGCDSIRYTLGDGDSVTIPLNEFYSEKTLSMLSERIRSSFRATMIAERKNRSVGVMRHIHEEYDRNAAAANKAFIDKYFELSGVTFHSIKQAIGSYSFAIEASCEDSNLELISNDQRFLSISCPSSGWIVRGRLFDENYYTTWGIFKFLDVWIVDPEEEAYNSMAPSWDIEEEE